jgi:hypothetical protein
MQFTIEQRNLLDGDAARKERREKPLGFVDATTAPDWAKVRIIQVRSAIVEGRAVPAPSRAFVAGCEQRALAAKRAVASGKDAELRRRLNEQAEQIGRESLC